MGLFNGFKIEISQNNPELRENTVRNRGKIFDLWENILFMKPSLPAGAFFTLVNHESKQASVHLASMYHLIT